MMQYQQAMKPAKEFKKCLEQKHIDKIIEQYNIYDVDNEYLKPLPKNKQQISVVFQEKFNLQEQNKGIKKTSEKTTQEENYKVFFQTHPEYEKIQTVRVSNPCRAYQKHLDKFISTQFKQEFTPQFVIDTLKTFNVEEVADPNYQNKYTFVFKAENNVSQKLSILINKNKIYSKLESIYNKILKIEKFKKELEATPKEQRAQIFMRIINDSASQQTFEKQWVQMNGKKTQIKFTDDQKEANSIASINTDIVEYFNMFNTINEYEQIYIDEIKLTQYNNIEDQLQLPKLSKPQLIYAAGIKLNQVLQRAQNKLQQIYLLQQGKQIIKVVESANKKQKDAAKKLINEQTDPIIAAQYKANLKEYSKLCTQKVDQAKEKATEVFWNDKRNTVEVGLHYAVVPKTEKATRKKAEKISFNINQLTPEQRAQLQQMQAQIMLGQQQQQQGVQPQGEQPQPQAQQ